MSDYSRTNYRPLTDPDDASAFRAFRDWAKSTRQPWAITSAGAIVAIVIVCLMGLGIVALIGGFIGGILGVVVDPTLGGVVALLMPGIVLVSVGVPLLVKYLKNDGTNGRWERAYRLHHFALANRMQWHPTSAQPNYPGSIFQIGHDRAAYDHFTANTGRYLDIGNLRYTTGSGKSQSTSHWGFMALKLDRRIPHCVLDAAANNGIFGSSMPTFGKDQILSLEGDFDKYFTLYCPREYERDALYIFTPDLMALLIDNVSAFDVEIIDDWMFVYSTRPWDSLDPWTWYRLFSIVHTVGRKTVDRTDYYRDARAMPPLAPGAIAAPPSAANNFVAPEGQRLKRRFNWIPLVIIGGILILPGFLIIGFVFISAIASVGFG